VESKQEIPECLEPYRPQVPFDAPLFTDDEDDDDDDDASHAAIVSAASIAQGATWDAGDNSLAAQGGSLISISEMLTAASNEGGWA